MAGALFLGLIVVVVVAGCLLTGRSYRRARRAAICDMAIRDGVLARYAIISDGQCYNPSHYPDTVWLEEPAGERSHQSRRISS